jgi:hypothetical protein
VAIISFKVEAIIEEFLPSNDDFVDVIANFLQHVDL